MASKNNEQTIVALLKCALCNENLNSDNQPKSLSCLHTFCNSCLTNQREKFIQDSNILCPTCHTNVRPLSEEDKEITSNLKLDVIVDKLLNVRQLQQSKRLCQICPEGVISTHWCQDCRMFLCDPCLVYHEIFKPNDKLIDVSEGMESEEKIKDFILSTKCSRHKERKFKFYCAGCRLCLCSSCLFEHCVEKFSRCVPVSIEKTVSDKKFQGSQLLEEIDLYLEKEKQQIENMELKIIDLNRQNLKKSKEIWKHIQETVDRLKENTSVLIAELEAKTKSEVCKLQKLIQLRQDHIKEIEISENFYRQLLQSFDNVDFLLNYSRLNSKCMSLLSKHYEDVSSTTHEVNISYNTWYIKTHEIAENVPLGRCWKNIDLIEDPSLNEKFRFKERISCGLSNVATAMFTIS